MLFDLHSSIDASIDGGPKAETVKQLVVIQLAQIGCQVREHDPD